MILYGGAVDGRQNWRTALATALGEANLAASVAMDPEAIPIDEVDYLLLDADGPTVSLAKATRLKAIFSLWAGVDWLVCRDDLPRNVPLVHMAEDGMTRGMCDYVAGHVMRYHLGLDDFLSGRPARDWDTTAPALSSQRTVGVMGLGVLGGAAARLLRDIGFQVSGWSRRRKDIPSITCFAGHEELATFLARSQILVVLLPLTGSTERIVDASLLKQLPEGACLINAARGGLIDDSDLIASLEEGTLKHATLDAFREEPLPRSHRFRSHPRITVTPHIASVTRPETAARAIVRQISRTEAGLPLEHVVDWSAGY